MYAMSAWALLRFIRDGFFEVQTGSFVLPAAPVPWVALVLLALAFVLLMEAVSVFLTRHSNAGPRASDLATAA
jgi:hypothetical protein